MLLINYKSTHLKLLGWRVHDSWQGAHWQRIMFVLLEGATSSNASDSDSLKTNSSELEENYIDNSSDGKIELYAIKTVPKKEVLPYR